MSKRAKITLTVILCAASVLMGLWFMGVVSFTDKEPAVNKKAVPEKVLQPDTWEIVYEGMQFSVDAAATAHIHESGCLNIRFLDDYLIQIAVEEETIDAFWNNRESKIQSVADSGYKVETEPERFTLREREYIRYIISMKDEDSEYDRTYMEVLFTPADDERRFLLCIKYDGIDMEALDPAAQTDLYDAALNAATHIIDTSAPAGKKDDEPGSLWLPNLYDDSKKVYLTRDSLEYSNGTLEVGYDLPKGCYVLPDALIGKNYRTEENIYINVTVWENTSITAEQKAAMHSSAGISKLHTEGKKEASGKTFYYYAYSILRSSKTDKKYTYNFAAFCDLKNGDLLEISGWSYDNEAAMDSNFYLDVMNISETSR